MRGALPPRHQGEQLSTGLHFHTLVLILFEMPVNV